MGGLARFVRNVASQDAGRRLSALKTAGDWLIGDMRLSWHHIDWWHDEAFNNFLDRFKEREGFNTHRKWTLWQLLKLTAFVDGDTAECGVFQGSSSWLICAANRHRKGEYIHHLFDSFEGLSHPGTLDGRYWNSGTFATAEAVVAANLEPFKDKFRIHKGWIPSRFSEVANRRFSFVHVDVDLHQPTLDSVEFFYERLNPGGILLCDDYGCSTCPGATKALDEFLAAKAEKMISLADGGGFFIKGALTGDAISPV